MKIHEYQGKALLREYGVPTPRSQHVVTVEDAKKAAEEYNFPVVVKAQVHVGGRGKAGGVKLAKSLDEVEAHAKAILGMDIKGFTVRNLLIEEGVDIKEEIYLSILVDRSRNAPIFIASRAGGMDIEEVAASTPEKIKYLAVNPVTGLQGHHLRELAYFLELGDTKEKMKQFSKLAKGVYNMALERDCSLVEINPMVVTGAGDVLACDCKVNFDDNASYRHPQHEELRDEGEEEPLEVEARKARVNYVKLDGKIGCIVNGAGLAMATMDSVKSSGGEPANFLDIGGGAKPEQVAEALRIITSDPEVNCIFFNIFGGIVRCDRVAKGILQALETLDLKMPIVVRLAGTNHLEAKELLKDTDLVPVDSMAEGAKKAVELSNG
jgi:succinyl-CoA synthetase beta subunit